MNPTRNLPLPEPAAGVEAYNAEREACLRLDVRKQQNYQHYLTARGRRHNGLRDHWVGYRPVKLDIENTSRCNFACEHCAVSTWPQGKRAADLTLEAFKALIDEQYGLVEIKLNGLGEALMQGDDYFEMVRYARARRIWVRMTTNASLLHLRDNYRKLIDAGVNEVDISIDGAEARVFEGIRIQSDFDRVVSNCALLNNYARTQGKPSAKMWTLVMRANVDQLPKHVELAAALGFQHLVFSLQMHGWGTPQLEERNRREAAEVPDEMLELLIASGRAHGVRVAFWDVGTKFETSHPAKLCPWPFERAVVTSDLRTVPCCMIGDPDAFELGKGQPFKEVWFGKDYEAFRRAHLDGNLPEVCRACYKAKA